MPCPEIAYLEADTLTTKTKITNYNDMRGIKTRAHLKHGWERPTDQPIYKQTERDSDSQLCLSGNQA